VKLALTVGLDEANSLSEPDRLGRVETSKPYARDMAFELPPYAVALIEIRATAPQGRRGCSAPSSTAAPSAGISSLTVLAR
jgi:hypothetical protein